MGRKWSIFVIHHSHTDIGYTDRQERITRNHIDFIQQAIEATEHMRSGARPEWKGFCWTCETFWPVEQFLAKVTPEWRQRFERALRLGDIELSANYLNMTELIDDTLQRTFIRRAVNYGNGIGVRVDSAMTADINGYGWGFAQALVDAGVQNLFSCVHTHHGMYPLGCKQMPFWWETPGGAKLLVWNGEHYHYGNVLGLVPNLPGDGGVSSHAIDEQLAEVETRLPAYLKQLEQEGYPYDFVPLMVSGIFTDNGPPNPHIAHLIHRWNQTHGDHIEIQMTTLTKFFRHLRTLPTPIPTYRGDWPDWWTDGVASTPLHTQIFRDAQRALRLVDRLDPQQKYTDPHHIEEAVQKLALYAEHTWGYSSSVYEPWNPMVQALGVRKEAYAAEAHRVIYNELDEILRAHGEAPLIPDRPQRYRVINPFNHEISTVVPLYVDHWEPQVHGFEVIEAMSGHIVPHQVAPASRGVAIWVPVQLKSGEAKTLILRSGNKQGYIPTSRFERMGADGIMDTKPIKSATPAGQVAALSECSVETPYVRIEWQPKLGIISWFDKVQQQELIRPDFRHGAFTPVYEVTPTSGPGNITSTRRKMGRNRKGINVIRSVGQMSQVTRVTTGPLFSIVELQYTLPGTSHFVVELTAYHGLPRVDVRVRLHKDSVWDPENLYISLPFTVDDPHAQLWIEKAGALVRPRVDQLPGTLTDFNCVQEGIAYVGERSSLAIGLPDNPLIQLGSLDYGERRLHGDPSLQDDPEHLYSWVLNNIWETNFKATTGGFYEFRYHLSWGPDICSPESAIARCHEMNTGVVSYRCVDES
ncbi:MAG: glycoside hydrolase [Alicyclobacillus sp.]|nr:glycoside hydrolase [Alicyclobacillus sp.]